MKITLTELKQIIRQELKRGERDDILNEGIMDFFRGLKGSIGLKLANFSINYVLKNNKYKENDLTPFQRTKLEELKKNIQETLEKSFSEIGQILNSPDFVNSNEMGQRIMSNKLTFEDFQKELSIWRKTQAKGITSRSIITDNTIKQLCNYFGIDDNKIENKSELMRDLTGYLIQLRQDNKDQVIYQLMQAQDKK